MRLRMTLVTASLALVASGCTSGAGSDPANQQLDREAFERLRGEAQSVGSDAFVAAAAGLRCHR